MKKRVVGAISVLVGTTIGAGFLGIPYVFAQSGFLIGLINLIAVGFIMVMVNLWLGEVCLRTKGEHQITKYAEMYLGKNGKKLMFFSMAFGIYSALLAYIIGEGTSISNAIFGTDAYYFVIGLLFWSVMSVIVYSGIKSLKKFEPVSVFLVLIIFLMIFIFFVNKIEIKNLAYNNFQSLFFPFGVILFSMLGYSCMPEIEIILKGREKYMKKAIVIGTMIPVFIYLLFALSVAGSFGSRTPEIATLALGRIFLFLGILTMFTAYLALSVSLEDMYIFDYNISKIKAWLLTCFLPLALFVGVGITKMFSFVKILGIAGVVSGGLSGVMIMLMNKRAKKSGNRKPEYSIWINWILIVAVAILFFIATARELSSFFKSAF